MDERMHDNKGKRRILLLGASGGLGRAIARHYAAPGVDLCLWARDQVQLERIAQECRDKGASVSWRSQDICDWQEAAGRLRQADEDAPFDLAIFASGNGEVRPAGAQLEGPDLVHRSITVNFTAPATLAVALVERMMERGSGQVVLIGSAASFHALPFASAYAGSKAGLARFGEALGIAAQPHGVVVSVVSPGFIRTDGEDGETQPRPFEISAEKAAELIARAAERGARHSVFPRVFTAAKLFDRFLPRFLREAVLRRLEPPVD